MDSETIRKITTSDLKRCIQLMTEEIKRRDKHNKEDIEKRWFDWHLEKTRALSKDAGVKFEDSMFKEAWADLIELAPEYRGTVCWHLIRTRIAALESVQKKEENTVTADIAVETLQKQDIAEEPSEFLKKQEVSAVL